MKPIIPVTVRVSLIGAWLLVQTSMVIAMDSKVVTALHAPAPSATTYSNGFDHDSYTPYIPSNVSLYDFLQHATVWKHLRYPNTGFDMPPWNVFVNTFDVEAGHAAVLNDYEFSGIFFNQSTGKPIDPPGSWYEIVINDPATAAIFSALSIWAWSTPVYFSFKNVPTTSINPADFSEIAVAHSVTLSVENSNTPPHIACGWSQGNTQELLEQAMNCPNLIIEDVEMSYFTGLFWGDIGSEYVQADPLYPPIDGVLFEQHYTNSVITNDRYILIDPPAFDIESPLNNPQLLLELSEILGAKARLRDNQ